MRIIGRDNPTELTLLGLGRGEASGVSVRLLDLFISISVELLFLIFRGAFVLLVLVIASKNPRLSAEIEIDGNQSSASSIPSQAPGSF